LVVREAFLGDRWLPHVARVGDRVVRREEAAAAGSDRRDRPLDCRVSLALLQAPDATDDEEDSVRPTAAVDREAAGA